MPAYKNHRKPRRAGARRRAGISQRVMLAIAGVLLVFAGWMFIRDYTSNPIPTDESTWVYFKCQACAHEFHWNAREVDQQLKKKDFGWAEDGKTMLLRCPKCQQPKAGVTTRPAASP